MRGARCREPHAPPVSLLIARMCCGCFPHSLPLEAGGRAPPLRAEVVARPPASSGEPEHACTARPRQAGQKDPDAGEAKTETKMAKATARARARSTHAQRPCPPHRLSAHPYAAQRAVTGWRGGLGRVGADLASAGSMRPPPSPARHVSTAWFATTKTRQETAGRDKSQPGSHNAYPQTRHATTTACERTANTSPAAEADAPTQPQEASTAAATAPFTPSPATPPACPKLARNGGF